MKVKDFIKVLQMFPENADIVISNKWGEFEGDFLFGLVHDSETDYESGGGYNTVSLCIMKSYEQNYNDLLYDDFELYGEKVWYNTWDKIDTWDCNGYRTDLVFNNECKHFIDVNKNLIEKLME